MIRDDRAVTSPVEYVLTIAIATILVTGLLVATTGHVGDQRDRTTRAQMDVVGQQLAGALETADRLVRMDDGDDPDTLRLTRDLPDQVIGNSYTITVTDTEVVVDSPVADRSVTVEHDADGVDTPVDLEGGTIEIVWNDPDLEVENV